MGKRYLLDTNVVLDFMGKKLPEKSKKFIAEVIDNQINISAINKIELLGFENVEKNLVAFVSFSEIYPVNDEIIDITIDLRRKYKIKLPDAIIAATAIAYDFILLSHNVKDFQKIEELNLLDVYEI